jgi:hypothetical protein
MRNSIAFLTCAAALSFFGCDTDGSSDLDLLTDSAAPAAATVALDEDLPDSISSTCTAPLSVTADEYDDFVRLLTLTIDYSAPPPPSEEDSRGEMPSAEFRIQQSWYQAGFGWHPWAPSLTSNTDNAAYGTDTIAKWVHYGYMPIGSASEIRVKYRVFRKCGSSFSQPVYVGAVDLTQARNPTP